MTNESCLRFSIHFPALPDPHTSQKKSATTHSPPLKKTNKRSSNPLPLFLKRLFTHTFNDTSRVLHYGTRSWSSRFEKFMQDHQFPLHQSHFRVDPAVLLIFCEACVVCDFEISESKMREFSVKVATV